MTIKCSKCGQLFDIGHDDPKAYWVGNGYACPNCLKRKKKVQNMSDDELIAEIHSFAKKILGDTYIKSKVDKQIKENLADGRKLTGILGTLKYWYEIRDNDIENANGGIGIVPYVYQEASEYWQRIKNSKKRYKNVQEEDLAAYANLTPRECKKISKSSRPKHMELVDLD